MEIKHNRKLEIRHNSTEAAVALTLGLQPVLKPFSDSFAVIALAALIFAVGFVLVGLVFAFGYAFK